MPASVCSRIVLLVANRHPLAATEDPLMSTPVTLPNESVVPVPVAADVPEGYWQREASHYPQPLSPIFRVFPTWSSEIWRKIATEKGMLADGIEFREIGGWVYQRIVPLGGKDRTPPPPWLMWVLVRTVPSIRARVRLCVRAVQDDLTGKVLDDWYASWKADQQESIARFRSVDFSTLDDGAFDDHLGRVLDFAFVSLDRHFQLTAPVATVAELHFFCEETLGWSERQTIELLAGLSVASTAPSQVLASLAAMASSRPAVREAIAAADASTPGRLRTIDPEFAGEFDDYQREFACRALRYEVIDPTLEEVPELTLGLIHDQVVRGYDPATEARALREQRSRALGAARQALVARTETERAEFERLLARAERYYPSREENEFYTVSAPLALMRYAILELGWRLAATGSIATAGDVFFLEMSEARATLRAPADRTGLVTRRKGERAWVLAHPGPAEYGVAPAGPPPLSVFPREAALNLKIINWATDRIFGGTLTPQAPARVIKGKGAAPGTYTGIVRVIFDETEFDRIQPGDVLVCPITSPVWSIVFPSVGALVTDTGGILSHPAIIAREYGIPAVVATANATALLRDGQCVTVDGQAGTVTLG